MSDKKDRLPVNLDYSTIQAIQDKLKEASDLGFDRFRIDGHISSSICMLWREGESEAAVTYQSSSIISALYGAIDMAHIAPEKPE